MLLIPVHLVSMECCWLQLVCSQAQTAMVVLEPAVWRRNRPEVAVGSHRPLLTDTHGGRVVPHAVSLWGKNPTFLEEHIQRCSPPNPQRWRLKISGELALSRLATPLSVVSL